MPRCPDKLSQNGGTSMAGKALKKINLAFLSTLALALAGVNAVQAQGAKTPIKIGVLTERSGVLGEMGVHNDVGIALAVKEINAAGGILGRPVEAVVADEQSDPTQAVNE